MVCIFSKQTKPGEHLFQTGEHIIHTLKNVLKIINNSQNFQIAKLETRHYKKSFHY